MPLYHYAQLRLGAGSIIEPGNFGRLIKRYNDYRSAQQGWLMARELIFESVRPVPKPSRFSACFVLLTEADAKTYRQTNDPNFYQVLHEVEIVDATLAQHTGGLSWIDAPPTPSPILDRWRFQASQYWAGSAGTVERGSELLTASQLRVIRPLE